MTGPTPPDAQPIYAHHVRALLARQAQAYRDLVGASYRRGKFRQQGLEADQTPKRKRGALAKATGIDFNQPSPLTRRTRQTGGRRVPHFDMKPMRRTIVPTSKSGKPHGRYKGKAGSPGSHYDYVTNGAKVSVLTHLAYIQRDNAVADLAEDLVIDMLDEQVLRGEKNARAIYTNIAGGVERQRNLFVAAERCERTPIIHHLTASTADLAIYDRLADFARTPGWVREMGDRLRIARRAALKAAADQGKEFREIDVVVADVTPAEAYDRLTWFDTYPSLPKPEWQQGRTGRSHYRMVYELPADATSRQHGQILRAAVDMLAADGWMAVGAIHMPDPQGDKRNHHLHIDAYDRPARWIDEAGAWDFEIEVRKNGKTTFPYRQPKVSYRAKPDASGKIAKVNTAKMMRERFIDIVNTVMDAPVYAHGTYDQNGVALTPLAHMGGRAIALEQRGQSTQVGDRNAATIVEDDLNACHSRAEHARYQLQQKLDVIRPLIEGRTDASEAALRFEVLNDRLIQRRLDIELTDVVVTTSRSRADTVIAALTPQPGRLIRPRTGDAALLAAAHRHVAWVERHSPSDDERRAEERETARIKAKIDQAWDVIHEAIADERPSNVPIRYIPQRSTSNAASSPHPAYENAVRGRLRKWLARNGCDPSKLVLTGDTATLGPNVPRAIDTNLIRFSHEDEFQHWLLRERTRRADEEVAKVRRKRIENAAAQRRAMVTRREADRTADLNLLPVTVDPANRETSMGEERRAIVPSDVAARPTGAATDVPSDKVQGDGGLPVPPKTTGLDDAGAQSRPVSLRPTSPARTGNSGNGSGRAAGGAAAPRPKVPPHIRSKGPDDDLPPSWPGPRDRGR